MLCPSDCDQHCKVDICAEYVIEYRRTYNDPKYVGVCEKIKFAKYQYHYMWLVLNLNMSKYETLNSGSQQIHVTVIKQMIRKEIPVNWWMRNMALLSAILFQYKLAGK